MKSVKRPVLFLLCMLPAIGAAARGACAGPETMDVPPGAFGEAIDGLDAAEARWCA